MRKLALVPIRVYQYAISPMMASHCRFYPSCSCYAYEAIEQHGLLRGSWLAVRRLGRCHPWHPGGYDPVPPASHSPTSSMAE
jgi:putative membrane protein insertion efficiency factor